MKIKIVLTALDSELLAAWTRFCGSISCVSVHHGSITEVNCDALVSPANSFGFMDGGVDATYIRYFGRSLEENVKRVISDRHGGELPVGCADLVETGHTQPRFLVVAPTMRVPTVLKNTVNPYLATRAALRLLLHGTYINASGKPVPLTDQIETIAFPGMGTGVGQVSPNVCAKQVETAIRHTVLGEYSPPATWAEASERHQLLYGGRISRLQHR